MGTVGVVLIPALGLSDLLVDRRLGALQLGRSRRGGCVTVVDRSECCGGFGVCLRVVLRYAFFTPGQNTNQFYSALAASPVDSPFSNVALSIFLILARMAAVGVTYEAVNGMVIALFVITYTVLLLVLPNFNAGMRFLVPHLLLLGAFAVRGINVVPWLISRGGSEEQILRVGTAALGLGWRALVPSPLPSGHWNLQ